MRATAAARRFAIFAVIFGTAMALAVWRAGGIGAPGGPPERSGTTSRPEVPTGDIVPIDAGAGMGSGSGVRIARDAVEVVDGEPRPYRAFEASWERQTPIPGGSVDERRLRTEDFAALVFHRRPTAEEPRPPAVEGPGTTRLTARAADLEMRAAAFRALLAGDVEVVRHDVDADLTLRTPALDVERIEDARGAEELHATTAERVVLDGQGVHVEGTGMEADLGRRQRADGPPARVLLRREVTGSILTRQGALSPLGGDEESEPEPALFSCSGAAELMELPGAGRRGPAPWLLTLQDDVEVRQGPMVMTCDALEVELRRGRGDGPELEILRVIADGDVVVTGTDPATGETWSLRGPRSVTTRDARDAYDVEVTGGCLMTFDGTLRGHGEDAEKGRVEIRCAGPATLHTAATPARPGTPLRTRVTFREDVVARQWDAAGEVDTEITAPEIVLLGNRLQTGDARLDPETLAATGNTEQRAVVRRESLTAEAQAATWRVLRDQDLEKLLLSGQPTVRFRDVGGMNLLGAASADAPAVLHVDAGERIEVTWRHDPDPELGRPEGEPYVVALARGGVVARRMLEDRETYRLESASLDATLAADLEPTSFRAYGDVVVTGAGEREGERRVELRGDRLSADRAPGEGSEWVRTDVLVFGQPRARATARIREAGSDGAQGPEHVILAEQLRYEEGGTLVVARRDAEVRLQSTDAGEGSPAEMTVSGSELRAYLNPPDDPALGAPDVLRVEGEGGVALDTAGYRVTGSTLVYDRTTGIAVAQGRPARGILLPPGGEIPPIERQSVISSETIRAEFDTTEERPGRPRRVTCDGGELRFLQPLDPADPSAGDERFTLRAKGPIEVLGETASAERDVEIVWESDQGGPRMQQDARLLCERAELTFDADAEGEAADRIRRAVATGSRERPAQLFSPRIDATADRMESWGPWIELLSPWGRRARVTRRDPAESFSCEKGRYNYRTQEFEATRARAE